MLGFKSKKKSKLNIKEEFEYIARVGQIHDTLQEGDYEDVLALVLHTIMEDEAATELEDFTKVLVQAAVAYSIIKDPDTEYETFDEMVKGFMDWVIDETTEENN